MKLIWTAAFTIFLLRRSQSLIQLGAIILLSAGIGVVQMSQSKGGQEVSEHKNMSLGLFCVSGAAMISGFAGVYFEMVLKTTTGSVWIRNIQLALFSIFFSAITCFFHDKDEIFDKGFFFGYNDIVWTGKSL